MDEWGDGAKKDPREQSLLILPGRSWPPPYSAAELPFEIVIRVLDGRNGGSGPVRGLEQEWIDYARVHQADEHGFVRVQASANIVDGKPGDETLILKDYLNALGFPLIVSVNNAGMGYSDVFIRVEPQLTLEYLFDVKKFPEHTWKSLYERVLNFLHVLETSKQQ